jgi:hypothetical protein
MDVISYIQSSVLQEITHTSTRTFINAFVSMTLQDKLFMFLSQPINKPMEQALIKLILIQGGQYHTQINSKY